jgi:hypothetical protein
MTGEQCIINLKAVEGSNHGLIKGISQHLSGETEENHENLSGYLVSWLRFKLGTS